ncbi:DNA replication complex GINS protein SLD5 isoform X1 [Phalaenopsis equestris]|uniref:DNA replication complex GINS protein SLD5 isoform X1 n=1 Tax=Phalaenopsis equestris TaxID=78828 RepID=UPI0009E34682|nr:DNA replication complex GINS protein SLD5 isoform X1 [Phalaenopsis equestris]
MEAETDVDLLKRAWRNEKAAPEILQFEAGLVQRVREQIQLLEETVEEFTENRSDDLVVSLYQMDLDRALFLLRSYLRIRLQKIEKYMIHISKTNLWNRLSEQEQRFAKRCIDIMENHLEQTVLSRLPYGYQSMLKQSISSEEDDMVPEPQLDTFVFCKAKNNVGAFQLDDIIIDKNMIFLVPKGRRDHRLGRRRFICFKIQVYEGSGRWRPHRSCLTK